MLRFPALQLTRYTLAKEAATTADAVCMFAMMLQTIFVVKRTPLKILAQKARSAYHAVLGALAATSFEGVQGPVEYAPNSTDPSGPVILQQLQAIVDVADFTRGSFSFLGKSNLGFHFPGKMFATGPSGAASISGALGDYQICTGGLRLNMSPTCVKSRDAMPMRFA
jgi:hypothetical protein